MKSSFGAEPALGIVVLLVSLPIVGALAYIIVGGAIEHPAWALTFWGAYAIGLVLRYLLEISERRLSERANRVVGVVLIFGGLIGITFTSVAWPLVAEGRATPLLWAILIGFGLGALLVRVADKKISRVDYHQK